MDVSIGLNTITTEIIRTSNACRDYSDFRTRIIQLFDIFRQNQWPKNMVVNKICKIFANKPFLSKKYGITTTIPLSLITALKK